MDNGRRWAILAKFASGRTSAVVWPGALISSPTQRVAWVTTPDRRPTLYVTASEGRHWSRRRLRFHSVWSIVALNAQTSVAQTGPSAIFVTHDGGSSWRRARLLLLDEREDPENGQAIPPV